MDYSYSTNKDLLELKINKDMLLELKQYKKYFDVLYYKICQLDNNIIELEEYKNIIYPEIVLLYLEIKNNHNKIHNNILLKIDKIKYYAKLYSYK